MPGSKESAARSDRDHGRRHEHDLLGLSGRGGRHGLDLARPLEVFTANGLPSSLYTDRGSHYFFTPKAGEAVDKEQLTQVGRALAQLGIEHIPAYSPQARGRTERMFGTLQERLPKELALAGIADIAEANRFIREVYLPRTTRASPSRRRSQESAFVAACDPASLATSCASRRSASSPATTRRLRGAQAAAAAKPGAGPLRQGPRQGAPVPRRHPRGVPRPALPCALQRARRRDRRGPDHPKRDTVLAAVKDAAPPTADGAAAILDGDCARRQRPGQVGTKKRPSDRTKKLTRKMEATAPSLNLIENTAPGRPPLPNRPRGPTQKRTIDVLPKPDNLTSYRRDRSQSRGD